MGGLSEPYLYDNESFNSHIKAVAWNPNYEGVFAVGGSSGDQIIRMYDLKQGKGALHTIKCNNPITSLNWRKTKLRSTKD